MDPSQPPEPYPVLVMQRLRASGLDADSIAVVDGVMKRADPQNMQAFLTQLVVKGEIL